MILLEPAGKDAAQKIVRSFPCGAFEGTAGSNKLFKVCYELLITTVDALWS